MPGPPGSAYNSLDRTLSNAIARVQSPGRKSPARAERPQGPQAERSRDPRMATARDLMKVEEQVVSLFAGTQGYLDNIPVDDVGRFEDGLLELVKSQHSGLLSEIVSTGAVDEDALNSIITAYAENFETSDGSSGISVEAQEQPDADTEMVDSDTTLPETDIARGQDSED